MGVRRCTFPCHGRGRPTRVRARALAGAHAGQGPRAAGGAAAPVLSQGRPAGGGCGLRLTTRRLPRPPPQTRSRERGRRQAGDVREGRVGPAAAPLQDPGRGGRPQEGRAGGGRVLEQGAVGAVRAGPARAAALQVGARAGGRAGRRRSGARACDLPPSRALPRLCAATPFLGAGPPSTSRPRRLPTPVNQRRTIRLKTRTARAELPASESLDGLTADSLQKRKPFLSVVCAFAILDPPRQEVVAAIEEAHRAGITGGRPPRACLALGSPVPRWVGVNPSVPKPFRPCAPTTPPRPPPCCPAVKMITGDHALTGEQPRASHARGGQPWPHGPPLSHEPGLFSGLHRARLVTTERPPKPGRR